MTNTTAVDFQKGQTVTFAQRSVGEPTNGWGARVTFNPDDTAIVTRVNRLRLTVKTSPNATSYNVFRSTLDNPNGEVWVAPPPRPKSRKLGEMPTEGGHLPMDDPRFAWVWDDVAKLATDRGYCSTYDEISDKLKRQLENSKLENGIADLVTELRDGAEIEIHSDNIK